jgi:formylglycine-generating enzyme required for sulfatase activity
VKLPQLIFWQGILFSFLWLTPDPFLPTAIAAENSFSATTENQMVKISSTKFTFPETMWEREHHIKLTNFAISEREVTVGDWKLFVGSTGYITDAEANRNKTGCMVVSDYPVKDEYKQGISWRNPGFFQDDDHPVVCVSLNDIWEYIEWLNARTAKNYRLPSAEEWEYVAFTGYLLSQNHHEYSDVLCEYGNGADRSLHQVETHREKMTLLDCDDGYVNTAPAKQFTPNKHGIYDLIGNANEWADTERENKQRLVNLREARDAWQGGRSTHTQTLKGGSWSSRSFMLNALYDTGNIGGDKTYRTNSAGFRIAQSLPTN